MKHLPYRGLLLFLLTAFLCDGIGMAMASETPLSHKILRQFLLPGAAFPTQNTPLGSPDRAFHQWSWQAYVWATALDENGVPRFMRLPNEEDLLSSDPERGNEHPRPLKLAARSLALKGDAGFTEGAGAFVEADGNILIAPNGYPVYASVHMNSSYFATAVQNLVTDGGYTNQPVDSTFDVGAAVFKATWLRLADGEKPPEGAFTTQAEVPILVEVSLTGTNYIMPSGMTTNVTVALVGLHVVGCTINHPEFVWATFEHKRNSPQVPDNRFTTNRASPHNYTFYSAHTSFANANQSSIPSQLTLDFETQRFTPINSVVLENKTGGESKLGAVNVRSANSQGHRFLRSLKYPQSKFANYNLIGTVWMGANTYNLNSTQTNALGSLNLANSTAETFQQFPTNSVKALNQNCFMCHNPQSYSTQANIYPSPLPSRLIGLSHVLGVGTGYAVPNLIAGPVAN